MLDVASGNSLRNAPVTPMRDPNRSPPNREHEISSVPSNRVIRSNPIVPSIRSPKTVPMTTPTPLPLIALKYSLHINSPMSNIPAEQSTVYSRRESCAKRRTFNSYNRVWVGDIWPVLTVSHIDDLDVFRRQTIRHESIVQGSCPMASTFAFVTHVHLPALTNCQLNWLISRQVEQYVVGSRSRPEQLFACRPILHTVSVSAPEVSCVQ